MKIKIWGCRGSLPVSGKRHVEYGGNTTCVEITLSDGGTVIFDAGTGLRNLGKEMMDRDGEKEVYLYLSHSHWDHLMGFPFFGPAFSPDWKINIRGGPIAKETLRNFFEHTMEPPYFPARMSAMKAEMLFTHGIPKITRAGSAEITPIPLSHPNGGYGFRLEDEGKTVVFLTDNELDHQHHGGESVLGYTQFCRDAELILHDAQYTPQEYKRSVKWGHSSFVSAVQMAINSNAGSLGLIHHDPDHDDAALDRFEKAAEAIIRKRKSDLTCFAAWEGQEITL